MLYINANVFTSVWAWWKKRERQLLRKKQKVQSRSKEALNYYKSFLVSLHNEKKVGELSYETDFRQEIISFNSAKALGCKIWKSCLKSRNSISWAVITDELKR